MKIIYYIINNLRIIKCQVILKNIILNIVITFQINLLKKKFDI